MTAPDTCGHPGQSCEQVGQTWEPPVTIEVDPRIADLLDSVTTDEAITALQGILDAEAADVTE